MYLYMCIVCTYNAVVSIGTGTVNRFSFKSDHKLITASNFVEKDQKYCFHVVCMYIIAGLGFQLIVYFLMI